MAWTIKLSEVAIKQLSKIDKTASKRIIKYLRERLENQKDPSIFGKPLLNDKMGLWRYRIDNYRIICDINKKELIILVLRIGHRKDIYK